MGRGGVAVAGGKKWKWKGGGLPADWSVASSSFPFLNVPIFNPQRCPRDKHSPTLGSHTPELLAKIVKVGLTNHKSYFAAILISPPWRPRCLFTRQMVCQLPDLLLHTIPLSTYYIANSLANQIAL